MLLGGLLILMERSKLKLKDFYYKKKYPLIDKSVYIGKEVLINSNKNDIRIGKGTYIQRNCEIVGKVRIGNNCAIASNVNIRARTHKDYLSKSIEIEKPITIGNNVWIGTNVFIKEGIKIGDCSVIGANAVVTKDIPIKCIYAGVPAKCIKKM